MREYERGGYIYEIPGIGWFCVLKSCKICKHLSTCRLWSSFLNITEYITNVNKLQNRKKQRIKIRFGHKSRSRLHQKVS